MPDAPENVRLVDPLGNEWPCDVTYLGVRDGMQRWEATPTHLSVAFEHGWKVRVGTLPRTELVLVGDEDATAGILCELAAERKRQTAKHGDQSHLPDGTGPAAAGLADWAKQRTDAASQATGDGTVTFEHILTEEWAEALAEDQPAALRAELIQVAAVAVQWIEAIDKRPTDTDD